MSININAGLMPPIIKKEDDFGIAPLDFNLHDGEVKGLPVNQSFESPINVVDSYNKEVIKSTFGSQVQKDAVLLLGERSVSANFGHQIGLNDFVVIGNMFFQNKYEYTDEITNGTIVAITNVVDVVTIEVTDIGTIVDGQEIEIRDRVLTDENGLYTISNVTATTFDIDYVGGFDVDLTGSVSGTIGKHEMLIEDVNDCGAQLLENSYSVYLPQKFPDKDATCETSQGDLYKGVVPKSLEIDFVEASYTVDTMGKSLEDFGDKSPRIDDDYEYPIGIDGKMRKNFGTLQKWNGLGWDNLETLSLNLSIIFGAEDSQKVRSAGELSRAVVDGVDLSGSYETLYVTEDEQKNVSNSIYEDRRILQSGGLYRLALENTSGEAIYIEGNIKFLGEELTRENGGWKLKADFQFLRNIKSPNVKLTCINRYNKDLTDLF